MLVVEDLMMRYQGTKPLKSDSSLLRTGILTAVGIALHNFPEGFAVGSGFGASISLGVMITSVIVIHDIPEGIAMAVPMRAGGFARQRPLPLQFFPEFPWELVPWPGRFLEEYPLNLSAPALDLRQERCFYVVYGELVVESKNYIWADCHQ